MLVCRSCGTANPGGSRFCGSCGGSLAPLEPCPRCGADNPAEQRFCNSCGLELAGAEPASATPRPTASEPDSGAGAAGAVAADAVASAANVDGERKQVTVLFADVKGSMELAERVDPERWRGIMQRFFSLLSDAVRRFEGTVDKFTGDGIMAVFGAPIAHEDHAQRACYAALRMLDDVAEYAGELRRTQGLSFSTRIGIDSGEVIAGSIGEDGSAGGEGGRLEYTAVGHTVGLAQRMEALAEPGKAYLTESTAKLAGGFLELKDLGEFEVKGASRPIAVHELVGVGSARSRLDLSRERGFSRFVGRAEEMAVLEQALERAREGRGTSVGVVADAGIGKSRLCHEFAQRCRASGIEVYEAQAQSHGEAVPLLPVLQMLRAYFGIDDRDSERQAREKIAGRMLLLDAGFADDLPLVFDFLAVPDPDRPPPKISAEARLRALRGVIRRLVRAPGRREPVVNVIEDLHWMDEGSHAFLTELIAAVEGTPTLALVNFRPQYSGRWADSPNHRTIPLVPLGPEATRELFEDLAGTDPSLDGLAELVHERTAGNPFFVEEVVREMAETGYLEGERGAYRLAGPVEEAEVPATVQAVLAARIDRLSAAGKRLLQAASVLDTEVPEPTLRRVIELGDDELVAALAELCASGFLYEAELYPERVLAFRHPLTREVAYGSQLAEQRALTHLRAASALQEASPDRHDELAALISQHFEAAGEPLQAARWSARAAHWAGHSHPHDALRLWRRVMELVSDLPEDLETAALGVSSRLLQLNYAWRLGMEQERADSLAAEAREIATRTGDLRSLALLQMLASGRPGVARHASVWTSAAKEAIALADRSGDDELRVTVRTGASYAFLCAGELDDVEALLDEALATAGDDHSTGKDIIIGCPVAWALMGKGIVRRERAQLDAAEELFESALRIAGEQGDLETQGWVRGNQAGLLALRGEHDQALALAQRNHELIERIGDVFSRAWSLSWVSFIRLTREDFADALDQVERADRLYSEAMGSGGEAEGWRRSLRAEALLGLGRIEEAVDDAEDAAQTLRERALRWWLPRALRILAAARAAAQRPGVDDAFDEAERVARRIGHMHELEAIAAARAGAPSA